MPVKSASSWLSIGRAHTLALPAPILKMAYRFQISAQHLSWPPYCACCGTAKERYVSVCSHRNKGRRVVWQTTRKWKVPYCNNCALHRQKTEIAAPLLKVGLFLTLVWVAFGMYGLVVATLPLVLLGAVLQGLAKSSRKSTCCSTGSAVRYEWWHGATHSFVFSNHAYLEAFLESNSRKARSEVDRSIV